jgi:hypothetical protein
VWGGAAAIYVVVALLALALAPRDEASELSRP